MTHPYPYHKIQSPIIEQNTNTKETILESTRMTTFISSEAKWTNGQSELCSMDINKEEDNFENNKI